MGQMKRICWLCGEEARWDDPLDMHHIFPGPFRKKSDQLGLKVPLHHVSCHLYGERAVHNNRETMLLLKQYGQEIAMQENGWDTADFIREFGKNYL
jgi:hypothetical protein